MGSLNPFVNGWVGREGGNEKELRGLLLLLRVLYLTERGGFRVGGQETQKRRVGTSRTLCLSHGSEGYDFLLKLRDPGRKTR